MSATFFSFDGPEWRRIDDVRSLLKRINPVDGRFTVNWTAEARERDLPMYDGVRLICLSSAKWPAGLRICYLAHEDELFRLDGSSTPIHEVNEQAGIRLSDENVLFYLSFFCFFVRGDQGPFYVLHDMTDGLLPAAFAGARKADDDRTPEAVFREPKISGRVEGDWRTTGMVFYANALFMADFRIEPEGMIEMVDDEPILSDLPCRIEAPLTPSTATSPTLH